MILTDERENILYGIVFILCFIIGDLCLLQELRFIFPALPMLVLCAAVGVDNMLGDRPEAVSVIEEGAILPEKPVEKSEFSKNIISKAVETSVGVGNLRNLGRDECFDTFRCYYTFCARCEYSTLHIH